MIGRRILSACVALVLANSVASAQRSQSDLFMDFAEATTQQQKQCVFWLQVERERFGGDQAKTRWPPSSSPLVSGSEPQRDCLKAIPQGPPGRVETVSGQDAAPRRGPQIAS
jgi:hypothetical protein